MTNWTKVATDVAVGGGAGVVDQLVQNADNKRIVAKPTLGIMSQYGTYYNYGVPILSVLGVAFGFLRGEWATRGILAGSQLAGRKATSQITKTTAVPYRNWSRERQKALPQVGGDRTQIGIPVIEDAAILV